MTRYEIVKCNRDMYCVRKWSWLALNWKYLKYHKTLDYHYWYSGEEYRKYFTTADAAQDYIIGSLSRNEEVVRSFYA